MLPIEYDFHPSVQITVPVQHGLPKIKPKLHRDQVNEIRYRRARLKLQFELRLFR